MFLSFISLLLSANTSDTLTDTTLQYLDKISVTAEARKTSPANEKTIEHLSEITPSVYLIRRGPNSPEPIVRNGCACDLFVTLDGARVQTACPDHMDPLTAYLDDNVEKVTVNTGANATARGFSPLGNIDISLQKAVPGKKKATCSLGAEGTSINSGIKSDFSSVLSSKKFADAAHFSVKNIGDYSDPSGKKTYSGKKSLNIRNSATIAPDSNISLSTTFLYDRFHDAGYPALYMDVDSSRLLHGTVSFRGKWKERSLGFMAYLNRTDHAMDDTHRKVKDMHMDMPGSGRTCGGYALLTEKHGLYNGQLRFELWNSVQSASMTMYSGPNPTMYMETWPKTATTGITGTIANSFLLNCGLTLNSIYSFENRLISVKSITGRRQIDLMQPNSPAERNYQAHSIALSADISPGSRSFFNISFTVSERIPLMDELYGYYFFDASKNFEYIGNPLLKPENILQGELNGKLFLDRLRLDYSIYGLIKSNAVCGVTDTMISPVTKNAFGVRRWSNSGTVKRVGLETIITFNPINHFEISSVARVNYSIYSSSFTEKNSPVNGGTLSAAWHSKYFSIKPEFEWEPPQYRYDYLSFKKHTGGYLIPHLRFSGTVPDRFLADISWYCGIENVFNRKWRSNQDWNDATNHNSEPLYRPGRNYYLGIRIGI